MTASRSRIPGLRPAAILAAVVLLVGIGSTAGFAAWTGATAKSASVTAASTGVSATGIPDLSVTYKGGFAALPTAATTTLLADTAMVTIANTGSTPLALRITSTGGDATLNGVVALQVWKAAGATCAADTPVGANATANTLASPPAMPSDAATAAAGTSLSLCLRTSITAANYSAVAGLTTTPTVAVVGTVGTNWTSTSSAQLTQVAAFTWFQVVRDIGDRCLGSNNNSAAAGATLVLATCKPLSTTSNQSLRFAPVSGDATRYRIYIGVGTTAGPVLSGNNGWLGGGAVTLATLASGNSTASNNQQWSVVQHGSTGSYRIVLKSTETVTNNVLCLTAANNAENAAFTVTQCGTSLNTGDTAYVNQHFTFTEVP